MFRGTRATGPLFRASPKRADTPARDVCSAPCHALRRRCARVLNDFRLSHRRAVAPGPHEALLRRVSEGVLAVLTCEAAAHQRVGELPGPEPVERVERADGC